MDLQQQGLEPNRREGNHVAVIASGNRNEGKSIHVMENGAVESISSDRIHDSDFKYVFKFDSLKIDPRVGA